MTSPARSARDVEVCRIGAFQDAPTRRLSGLGLRPPNSQHLPEDLDLLIRSGLDVSKLDPRISPHGSPSGRDMSKGHARARELCIESAMLRFTPVVFTLF